MIGRGEKIARKALRKRIELRKKGISRSQNGMRGACAAPLMDE
jgi:hypothetical protein